VLRLTRAPGNWLLDVASGDVARMRRSRRTHSCQMCSCGGYGSEVRTVDRAQPRTRAVVEQTSRGERSLDICSRLVSNRSMFQCTGGAGAVAPGHPRRHSSVLVPSSTCWVTGTGGVIVVGRAVEPHTTPKAPEDRESVVRVESVTCGGGGKGAMTCGFSFLSIPVATPRFPTSCGIDTGSIAC
jgi:hypothetical protein